MQVFRLFKFSYKGLRLPRKRTTRLGLLLYSSLKKFNQDKHFNYFSHSHMFCNINTWNKFYTVFTLSKTRWQKMLACFKFARLVKLLCKRFMTAWVELSKVRTIVLLNNIMQAWNNYFLAVRDKICFKTITHCVNVNQVFGHWLCTKISYKLKHLSKAII